MLDSLRSDVIKTCMSVLTVYFMSMHKINLFCHEFSQTKETTMVVVGSRYLIFLT